MPDVGGILQGTLLTTVVILAITAVATILIIVLAMRWVRSVSGGGKDAQRIAASGIDGQGRILGVKQTSMYVNRQPLVDIHLEVHPANGQPPYTTTVRRVVSLFQISQFQQGAVLPLRFDPADPSKVVILV
jgi:hypothetical protein